MNYKNIGRLIAVCREEKGMSQARLALWLGVPCRTVSKWEAGRALPGPSACQELTQLLGVSLNELLAGARLSEEQMEKSCDQNIRALLQANQSVRKRCRLLAVGLGAVLCIVVIVGALYLNAINHSNVQISGLWDMTLPTGWKEAYHIADRGFEDAMYYSVFTDAENRVFEEGFTSGRNPDLERRMQELFAMMGVDSAQQPDFSRAYTWKIVDQPGFSSGALYCVLDQEAGRYYFLEDIR